MANISNEIKNSIINEMVTELHDRDYYYDTYCLDDIVTECFKQKNALLDLLSRHPLWNPEKLMIQFDADYERRICTEEIYNFYRWLALHVKGLWQYGYTNEEQSKEYHVCNFISNITEQFFNESMKEQIDFLNTLNENYKLRTNMKASKAIGKICREEGWDKLPEYNQRYAALCDCLNPIKVKRHTCISLNPIDFLLMSNGTSWESCHYIGDADDAGCYSSGTISYMLDEHSFVFYTVDAEYNGNQIERQPKIQREMFGYNDEVIAQLRLYPQSNDCGAEQIYDDIRAIVQQVIADCLEKPNLWVKSKNDTREVIEHGRGATCYPDWRSGNPGAEHCSISTLKERANGKEFRRITFGAEPICISCGNRHSYEGNISCCEEDVHYCDICGERLRGDEVCWGGSWEDIPYCEDCCTYCEDCGHYYPNDEVHEIDGSYVCENCLDNGDYYTCDACGEIHYCDNMRHTEDDYCYCEDCLDENAFYCDECNCWYSSNKTSHYDEETGNTYCDECYEDILEEREEENEEETA